jgi:hypothetical protein
MAPHAPFESLWVALHELRDTVRALELTVVEDRPADSQVVPVEDLGAAVADLLGTVHEAVEAAADPLGAPGEPPAGPALARTALSRCQEHVNDATRRLATEVGAFGRRQDLHDLAGARGRDWPAWTAEVDRALDRCHVPLWTVQSALLACWLDLTDRREQAATPTPEEAPT